MAMIKNLPSYGDAKQDFPFSKNCLRASITSLIFPMFSMAKNNFSPA